MSGGGSFAEVIGDPIDHSLSPLIHGFWLEKCGIDAEYRRARIGREEFAPYLEQRRTDPDWRGCNVTMPLKLDALAAADESSDRALGAAAANILVPHAGKLHAGNTDVGGMTTLFERLRAEGSPMDSITLVGNGGGARGALMALRLLGLTRVQIRARDVAAAIKLAVEFGLDTEPRGLEAKIASDGLINATPLGMTGMPPLTIDWSGMPASGWVFDLVTAPAETALLRGAREREMRTVTGIQMLVEQAAESFGIFFGKEAPRDLDAELMGRLGQ